MPVAFMAPEKKPLRNRVRIFIPKVGMASEKGLSILHLIGAILALTAFGSTAIAWDHWRQILDTCSRTYCGCVLFSEFLLKEIHGGSNWICHFSVFSSAPIVVIGGILSLYHATRSCFRKRPDKNRRSEDVGCICWPLVASLTALGTLLLLSQAIVLTHGYTQTCNEYRKSIVLNTAMTGQSAKVIHSRLSCTAIFDFMDYLEPFERPYYPKDELWRPRNPQDLRRGGNINTGVALAIGIGSTWACFICWLIITIQNISIARRVRTCCSF